MEHSMTFHKAPEFREALQSASEAFGMRFVLVEKDYWVTMVLQNLAFSEYHDLVVFKGGTSNLTFQYFSGIKVLLFHRKVLFMAL
jgi:predicted nucleotidyltransferase component of viral defense system